MPVRRARNPVPIKGAPPLPPAALTALHAGNRAQAIAIVQKADGVGPDEAALAVDAVLELKPLLKSACDAGTDGRRRGLGGVLGFVLVLGVLVVWVLFTRR